MAAMDSISESENMYVLNNIHVFYHSNSPPFLCSVCVTYGIFNGVYAQIKVL